MPDAKAAAEAAVIAEGAGNARKAPRLIHRPAVTDPLSGWVLDVAALVAFADRTRYAEAALATATHRGLTLLVPLPALSLAYDARPHHVAGPAWPRFSSTRSPCP
jgi:hypothetical protein